MRKNVRIIARIIPATLLLFSVLVSFTASAQVTGTRTIGVDYTSLAAAITDLNAVGISGPVTINVPAGYTETAPVGGYMLGSSALNASVTSTATLTIHKNGTGANPVLTAPVGTSTSTDGIFIIAGTDYVTIDAIDVAESAANTTATTRMEWGYALVKLNGTAPFDGCQHVTIQNCGVTLNRLNTPTVGIYAGNHTASSTTSLTITDVSDAMNDCRFYSNTIQNTVTGISLRGFAAPSPYTLYDHNNEVGDGTTMSGNTIQNFGGATSGSAINLQYQDGAAVAYNNIDNVLGGGVAGTTVLYGIYVQNGTNVSAMVTFNTIKLTQGTTSSACYDIYFGCSGTGTITASSNQLSAAGGSSGSMYMIYFGGANTTVTTNLNTFYNINVATTGTLGLIYHSTATSPEYITCVGNQTNGPSTPYINKTGSGGSVYGYYNTSGSSSGTATISNNNISWITMAGSPTFYGLNETNGGSGQDKVMENNIVSNITSAGGSLYGLRMGYAATISATNNTVRDFNSGSGASYGIYVVTGTLDTVATNRVFNLTSTGGSVYGIYVSGGTTINVVSDTVYGLSTSGTTSQANGIYQSGGTTVNIIKNKVYDVASTGTGGTARGLYLAAGTTNVTNNLVGDIRTPNYSGAAGTQLAGVYINGGTAHNLYYNTVFINGTSTGADFGSSAIYASTSPNVTLRNNIFVNTSTASGAGLTMAFRRSSGTLGSYDAASNNNLFYAGAPGASNVIFNDGTTSSTTLGDFKALVTPRDVNSVTENPPFLSTSGSSMSFLHINTAIATQVESGGATIAGVGDDWDGDVRAGGTGYSGPGTAPDLGADEGNFVPTDLSAPAILYTALPDACATGDRTLTATITDATGIPTTGTLVPRVYFRKNSGPWFSAPGTLASGTATAGDWNFTISAATVGGLAIADTISYFVIAQDIAPGANVGANPPGGLVASDVNTVTTYPTAPNSYVVLPSLSGTYNVGVGMAYATITDAIAAFNTSCISGPVVFQLMDATYPSETFPIVIAHNVSSSPTNTLTIRPAAGVAPTITGSATAIFRLDGADYVTIEGSNAPVTNTICPLVESSRDMTIANTSTSTSSAVIWLQTTTDGDSATNNIIRNCNIQGNSPTQTLAGIGSGSTTISNSSLGTGNDNNRFENNSISSVQIGIYSQGRSAAQKNNGTVITQNIMTTPAPNSVGRYGILTGFENGIVISGNRVGNVYYTGTGDVSAISVGITFASLGSTVTTGNEVTNATITNNVIDSFFANNAWSDAGIAIAGATTGTTTIANNMISRVLGHGTGGDFTAGIFIGGAAGSVVNVYHNSVSLSGTMTGASYPSFAIAVSGSDPSVNIFNNVFVNTSSNGSSYSPYSIGLASSSFSNLNSDNNDFYSSGADLAATGTLAGGGALATLADWQTTTGGDTASASVSPAFVSDGDPHLLATVANTPLNNEGAPVGVTTDIDCEGRSATVPDMGADEFTIPICSGAVAGTLSADTMTFCGSGLPTITATGFSTSAGITYQWLSSTDSVNFTEIAGATSTTYTVTTAIADTTYFRLRVSCLPGGVADSVAIGIIVNPLPTITVSPDGGSYCSASPVPVTMTASGASTYSWAPGTGLSATAGSTVTASPASTTEYTVTGTDAIGCEGTHIATVTVVLTPPTVTITPDADTVCAGTAAALVASSSLPDTTYHETFNSGLGLWVLDNTGSTSSAALTQWTSRPDGYVYSSVTYHSADATAFVMTNSDAGGSGFVTRTSLTSPSFSLADYSSATLTFNHYYRYISSDAFARVEISTDGGGTWTTVHDYRADVVTVGSAASFATATLDLSAYAGASNVKLRFNYGAGYGWYWAFDNVVVTGVGSYTNITWSPMTGLYTDPTLDTTYTGGAEPTVYASPAPGVVVYTATVTNGACSSTGTATVTAIPQPAAFAVTGGGTLCTGGTGVAVGLSGSASGVDYQLFNGATPVGTPVAGTGAALSFGLQTSAGVYTVLGTNSSTGCGTPMTDSAVIIVSPLPAAFDVTGGGSFCAGDTGVHIGLSGSDTGVTYQLYNGSTAVGSVLAGTGSGLDFGLQTAGGTYTVLATSTPGGCESAMTGSATVVVNPLPSDFAMTGGGAYCMGDTGVHIGLAGSQTGVNYELYMGGTASGSPVAGTGSAIDFGLVTSAGTYSVLATNAGSGCSVAMSGTLSVTINPVPATFTVTGGGTYCAGDTGVHIGISGSEIGVTYQTYIGGTPIGVPVAGTGGAIDFGLVTVPGTYLVVATSGAPCSTTMSGTATVVASPLPTAFSLTGGGGYCVGDTGVHIGLAGSQTGVTYQLYSGSTAVGAPVLGTGGAIDFGLYSAVGSYSASATNATTGCTSAMSGSVTVSVNPLPLVYTVTGGGAYCASGSGISVGLSGSQPGVNYTLYVGGAPTGTVAAGAGGSISFGLQTVVGTYSVMATNVSTGCMVAMTGSVDVSTIPAPAAYTVTGGGAYCAGGAGVAVGLSNSASGVFYQLYNGGSATGTPVAGTGGSISFGLQTAAGTYTVLATGGSTSCTAPMMGSVTVFINPTVSPTVAISNDAGGTICTGSVVTFSATPTNGGASPSYQWFVNGVGVTTAPTYSYAPVNGDLVRVVITSSSCASPDTGSATVTVTVSSGVTPSVSINATPGFTVCSGSDVTLVAMPTNGGTAPAYIWTKNGINVATGPAYTFTPLSGDLVSVRLISNHPCRTADTVVSTTSTITVAPMVMPSVNIVATPGTTISAGASVTLNAMAVDAGPSPTYQWSINSVNVPGATNSTFISSTFANGDIVTVRVTSSGVCAGLIAARSVTITIGVGVNDVANGKTNIRLMPNPNKGTFVVSGSVGQQSGSGFIEVTDLLGQVVYRSAVIIKDSKVEQAVQLGETLANGMYIMKFAMGDEVSTIHFVLEK